MSPVSKNSTELAFWCVQKLSDTYIPCPLSNLSFKNQTSIDHQLMLYCRSRGSNHQHLLSSVLQDILQIFITSTFSPVILTGYTNWFQYLNNNGDLCHSHRPHSSLIGHLHLSNLQSIPAKFRLSGQHKSSSKIFQSGPVRWLFKKIQ